jgi:hypothetical protein
MSGLLDRYRNEDLAVALSPASSKSESDRFHAPAANTARMRRALEHLHSLCVTEEAMESFVKFQMQYASMQNLPELGRPFKARRPMATSMSKTMTHDAGVAVEGGSSPNDGNIAKSEHRKISLLHRMLGRREKRESHGQM